jgi:hypothetical protein
LALLPTASRKNSALAFGMRREESDHIVVVIVNDFVVSPVERKELRCRVYLAWKWTKSWIAEPHPPQLEA